MKDIIIVGAFDRFNYGDMLMPMAIERYLKQKHPKISEHYRFRFASLSESDLTARDCLKTEKVSEVCAAAEAGSVIIVAGGEVIGATKDDLFMHNSETPEQHEHKIYIRKKRYSEFAAMRDAAAGNVWEYPYLPPPDCVKGGARVFYTAIGGEMPAKKTSDTDIRWARFKDAEVLSVRDARLRADFDQRNISSILAPCAVSLIADGIFSDLDSGDSPCEEPYFVFQCVNNPKGINVDQVVEGIKAIYQKSGIRPYLVPLGYASGHDDHVMLAEIRRRLDGLALMDEVGTLSSILAAFKNAQFYVGTSLHGTITAAAYAIPYFPFKRSIKKVGSYLFEWSKQPGIGYLNHVHDVEKLSDIRWETSEDSKISLRENAKRLSALAAQNLDAMAHKILTF